MENAKTTRNLRKSARVNDLQKATDQKGAPKSKDSPDGSPDLSSLQASGKRQASLDDDMKIDEQGDSDSPTEPSTTKTASSNGSGELPGHVCLCKPEPKIPRPRNAFILYRQHHQQSISARNPGLANPEISKIIGKQWKTESEDQKKIWQDLAVVEKDKHSEQYPDYRFQPRRVTKPGSISVDTSVQHTTTDRYRCPKCGGRSIKTPTSPFIGSIGAAPTLPLPNISETLTPTTRYLPFMSNLSLDSPSYRRRNPGPSNFSNIQVPSPVVNTGMYSPLTPESKRRRYNYGPASNDRRPDGPYYMHSRRESLPSISQLRPSPPGTANMLPPRTPRRSSADLNVLVPTTHDQSRSVEAMVMSVPFPVKIRVLGRITPPLKDPGPTSPAIQIRGAIIAVEGDDTSAVKELADWLQDHLSGDKEYHPRMAEPPKGPDEDNEHVTFEDYLDLIKDWHSKSKEMIQFITTPIVSDSDSEREKESPTPDIPTKPVVILPTYQLHVSDLYTSRIPIQDAYSPTDHWQWMATLWRGTIGPDLTIYVNSFDPKEGIGSAKLVELNDEIRCLTVRRDKGGTFDTSALRRVGFEVTEWIRAIGAKAT